VLAAVPADKERHQAAAGHRVEGQPPPQPVLAGSARCRRGYLAGVVAAAAGLRYGRVDVITGDRPAGQPGAGQVVEAERARRRWLWLAGIRRDDFQVCLGAEGEQRIVGSQADVFATGWARTPKRSCASVTAEARSRAV
jgi:hypothetical protein